VPDTTYLIGFDEETIYLRRTQFPTLDAATSEFRRLSVEAMGFALSDIEDIEGRAIEAPEHCGDSRECIHGLCRCPVVALWEFAP
jgi:hypothetical protein